jgi:hypothetical protein
MIQKLKKCLAVIGVASATTIASIAPVQAKEYVIVLSPIQSAEGLERDSKATLGFALSATKQGDHMLLLDGANVKIIGTFTVPDKPAYNNPKAKAQVNRAAIAALKQFSQHPTIVPEHAAPGAINLPHVLAFLGQNYGTFTDADIMLLADPRFADITHAEVSMKNKSWPNDGYLNAPASESIFSLQGRMDMLKGARIHWGYPDKSWIANGSYAYHVKRLWTLYAQGYGASLSTFTDDMPALWQRAASGATATAHDYKLEDTKTLAMIAIEEKPQVSLPIYERKVEEKAPAQDAIRKARNVEIALRSDCATCQLDLYVKPNKNAGILYHGNRKTTEGTYSKVYTQSPTSSKGHDIITLTGVTDLRDTLIGVNWASGKHEGGATGEIRIAIDGVTYASPYSMPKDNQGGHAEGFQKIMDGGEPCIHWSVLKPAVLLGVK